MFTLRTLADRLGPSGLQRAMGLHARVLRRNGQAIAAQVTASEGGDWNVLVSNALEGRCSCGPEEGAFCDHMGAAALEWLLEDGESRASSSTGRV